MKGSIPPAALVRFEDAIRAGVGKGASVSFYGNEHRTPLTFVMERVASRLDRPLAVFWAEGGAADVFCLRSEEGIAAVFNQRHLELSAQMLNLFTFPIAGEALEEMSERLFLRIIGEFALRHGDADLAVLCYVKGRARETMLVTDARDVLDLELSPINERYMFLWFFGLVHEFGHERAALPSTRAAMEEMLPDALILSALADGLDHENLTPDLRRRAEEMFSSSPLFSPANLREESSADLFACEVLLQSTIDIFRELGRDPVHPAAFVIEHMIFMNIMMLTERARYIAEMASPRAATDRNAIIQLALHHVAIELRSKVAHFYLQTALVEHYPGLGLQALDQAMSEETAGLFERGDAVQAGYRRALTYALGAKARADDHPLLEDFRRHLSNPIGTISSRETRAFCETARSMGVQGPLLTVLEQILDHPERPFSLPLESAHSFCVAWVHGPDGFRQPYEVDTRQGPVVPAFLPHNPLFDCLCESFRASLRPGFELKSVVLVVPRPETLRDVILQHASDKGGFGLVWEGQSEFDAFIAEHVRIVPDE